MRSSRPSLIIAVSSSLAWHVLHNAASEFTVSNKAREGASGDPPDGRAPAAQRIATSGDPGCLLLVVPELRGQEPGGRADLLGFLL